MKNTNITLVPLTADDREQFILDNQWAFKYGGLREFGERENWGKCQENTIKFLNLWCSPYNSSYVYAFIPYVYNPKISFFLESNSSCVRIPASNNSFNFFTFSIFSL